MPMLTTPTTHADRTTPATHGARPTRSGEAFRLRLAAALAATSCDVRPLGVADRASSPTRRYRAMA
jgi:hypothetical protein